MLPLSFNPAAADGGGGLQSIETTRLKSGRVRVEVVSVAGLHRDDEILLWWLAKLHVSARCVCLMAARHFEAELTSRQKSFCVC